MTLSIQEIQRQFKSQRFNNKVRHRDLAHSLGISEAELLAAHLGPDHAKTDTNFRTIRLMSDWSSIIAKAYSLGEVMALTRNESCVHEKVGHYGHPTGQNNELLLGKEIDLSKKCMCSKVTFFSKQYKALTNKVTSPKILNRMAFRTSTSCPRTLAPRKIPGNNSNINRI